MVRIHFYAREFHALARDLCTWYKGTVSRMNVTYSSQLLPFMNRHVRAVTRRLDDKRESSVSGS